MPKPVIFTVDDDPVVLKAVERDLRQRYSQDFRILSINSAKGALEALSQLQVRGEYVALFLTDQRMPQMSGTQFLEEAMVIFPDGEKSAAHRLCGYRCRYRLHQSHCLRLLPDEALGSAGRESLSRAG